MEEINPSQPILRWRTRLPPASIESPYPIACGYAIVQPSPCSSEAISEQKEDARGCRDSQEETHQPAVERVAFAVICEEGSKYGEGKDGGGRQENIEPSSATEDGIEDVYEMGFISAIVSQAVVAAVVR